MSGIDSDVATAPHAYRAPRKLTPAAWLGVVAAGIAVSTVSATSA